MKSRLAGFHVFHLHRGDKTRILFSMKRIGVVIILVLAFCGIADAAYIAQNEVTNTPFICNVQDLGGCNTVADSQYAYFFGVPVAEYGIFFYSTVFALAALELALFDRLLRRVLQGAALIGILVSAYFVSIQVYLIGAFCTYCIVSAIIALLILIFASLIEPLRARTRESLPPPSPSPLSMPPAV